MASKPVLEALELLHREIDKMQPAIRQVELAERVMGEARKIPEHYLRLVTSIEGQEAEFKQKLVDELEDHADQIREEVGALITAANTTISNLKKQEEQFGSMRKSLEPLINQLVSLQLETRLEKLQDRLNATEVTIGNRLTEEGRTRRDQLDNNANAIKLEVRQLTDTIKGIETLVSDQGRKQAKQLQDGVGQILGQFDSMKVQLDAVQQEQKAQKMLSYITWALILVTAATIIGVVKY